MKTITQEQITTITNYLKSVAVPAVIGANLIAIVDMLEKLPAVEEPKTKK